MMRRLMTKRPRNAGEGMRLGSLKAKYRKEYGKLRAEVRGKGRCYRVRLRSDAPDLNRRFSHSFIVLEPHRSECAPLVI